MSENIMTDDFLDACEYATLFKYKDKDQVVHIILTEEIPTQKEIDAFYEELNEDKEFGLAGVAHLLEHIVINKGGETVG